MAAMKPQGVQLAMNWPYVTFVAIVGTVALLFIGGVITIQVAGDSLAGVPIRGGWNWPVVLLVDLICVGGIAALYRKIYCDAHTTIDDKGVTQPGFLGSPRSILWREVTSLDIYGGVGYGLVAGKKRIVVTPYAYRSPDAVIEMLLANLERGRHPSNSSCTRPPGAAGEQSR
jgi:hypothetical protein